MSLIGTVRAAINGTGTWTDVGHKVEGLFTSDVVDPLEAFGLQFASDFGKAALQEAAQYVPQMIANPSSIGSLIPTVASDLETKGIQIAETDALQDANTIIGNALRTQLTAAQVAAQAPAVAAAANPAATDAPQG